MKKLFYIAMSLLLVTFVACNDDPAIGEVDLGFLELVSSDVKFDYVGGTGDIVVKSRAGTLTAKAADEWVSVATNGNIVTVTVPETTVLQTRNSSVTVSDGNRSVVVPVSQTSFSISLSSSTLNFAKEAGSGAIAFDLGVAITASSSEPWAKATIDNENDAITVAVEENRGNARSATLTFSAGEPKATVSITQASALSVASKSVVAKVDGGSYDVAFTTFADATVTAKSSVDWVTATVAGGKVTIAVAASNEAFERKATVTLTTDGGATEAIAVTQEALALDALTWEVWAEGTFTSVYNGTTKTTTISKAAEASSIFRIDSPQVEGYHYAFEWKVDEKSTTLTPIGIPFTYEGMEMRVQLSGLPGDGYPIAWVTDLIDIGAIFGMPFTYYEPDEKYFLFSILYSRWDGADILDGGYYSDETFEVTKFIKGDPWE